MTPDQAIEVAKANEPKEPDEWSSEGQNVGLRRGDWVSVTPDDYGNPVYGSILAWTDDQIVIRHEDPSVGKVICTSRESALTRLLRRGRLPKYGSSGG